MGLCPCVGVSLFLWARVSMYWCISVSIGLCIHVSVYSCFYGPMCPCVGVSMFLWVTLCMYIAIFCACPKSGISALCISYFVFTFSLFFYVTMLLEYIGATLALYNEVLGPAVVLGFLHHATTYHSDLKF